MAVQPKKISSLQKSSDIVLAGVLYLIAGIETVLLVSVEEALYPNYSIHANTLSDLGAIGAPTWMIVDAEGAVRSLCLLLGAYFLFRRTGRRGLMALFLVLGGIPVPIPENYVAIHSTLAVILFVSAVATMILSFQIIRSVLRYFALFLGILTAAATLILFVEYRAPLVQQTLGPGGWERLIAYPILIWFIAFGSYLLQLGKSNVQLFEDNL